MTLMVYIGKIKLTYFNNVIKSNMDNSLNLNNSINFKTNLAIKDIKTNLIVLKDIELSLLFLFLFRSF